MTLTQVRQKSCSDSAGGLAMNLPMTYVPFWALTNLFTGLGQHETLDGAAEGSFLDRERAILGEDAAQFGAVQDHTNNATTVEDDEGDLLGGDDYGGDNRAMTIGGEMNDFESSFPAIDTQNEVSTHVSTIQAKGRSNSLATQERGNLLFSGRLT